MAEIIHKNTAAEFLHVCDVESKAAARPFYHSVILIAENFVEFARKDLRK
jgi:hypothetical protein